MKNKKKAYLMFIKFSTSPIYYIQFVKNQHIKNVEIVFHIC